MNILTTGTITKLTGTITKLTGNMVPVVNGCIPKNYKFLGIIKNQPHYRNCFDEVYMYHKGEGLEYVADWLHDYKMIWTEHPILYRLTTINQKDYFYDVEFKDAYKYDYTNDLVIPQGYIYDLVDSADGYTNIKQ